MSRRLALALAACVATMASSSPASAAGSITIQNPEMLSWAIYGQKVYFRNLELIDNTWLGCCYNHYFDLTTDEGRAMFSTFLSYRLAGKPLVFLKYDPSIAGPIQQIGNW